MDESQENIFSNLSIQQINELMIQLSSVKQKKESILTDSPTLFKFSKEYLEYINNNFSKKYFQSARTCLKHLSVYFGKNMLLTNIDIKEAEKFKTYLSEKAPSGVSTYIKTLKAAWGVAVSWKYTDFNPFAKLKIKKKQKNKPSYLTKEEMELIIIHITSKVIKRIIKFAFYTGLRRQELLNIKYYDIDFDQKQLRVGNDTWNTKTSTQRFIPLCDRALEIIEACECKSADQFLFRKEGGGNFPYTGDYVSTQFRKAKISAGIKKSICFHSLRASTATILAELNTPPHIIQRILGHSTIQTTSIYLRPSDESLQKAISKLDGIN